MAFWSLAVYLFCGLFLTSGCLKYQHTFPSFSFCYITQKAAMKMPTSAKSESKNTTKYKWNMTQKRNPPKFEFEHAIVTSHIKIEKKTMRLGSKTSYPNKHMSSHLQVEFNKGTNNEEPGSWTDAHRSVFSLTREFMVRNNQNLLPLFPVCKSFSPVRTYLTQCVE